MFISSMWNKIICVCVLVVFLATEFCMCVTPTDADMRRADVDMQPNLSADI